MDRYGHIPYRKKDITSILLDQTGPVMEATLISLLARYFDYPRLDRSQLYRFHFSLYHMLYLIKTESRSFYLHTDPMRIRLVALPLSGECPWYNTHNGAFCKIKLVNDYCSEHGIQHPSPYPVFDCVKDFYLDPENITFDTVCDLESHMQKIMYYGVHKRDVDEALAFFDIPSVDRSMIYRRYRKMAYQAHPDRNGDEDTMKNINRHFSVLKAVL